MVVYALIDPKTREWRYIGKTKKPLSRRLLEHLNAARRGGHLYVYRWIRSLESAPGALEVERCGSPEELAAAEVEWIAEARRLGVRLTNATDGGEGISGWAHSAETRARISASKKNPSEETRALIRAARKDQTNSPENSPEIRARIRASQVGRKHSEETKEKQSAAHRGKVFSASTRAKMSESAKRRWHIEGAA